MDFLRDLPSRGTLTNVSTGDVVRGPITLYVCEHNTQPPEGQVIHTDSTNQLAEYMLKQRGKQSAKATADKGKRPAASAAAQPPEKRAARGGAAGTSTAAATAAAGAVASNAPSSSGGGATAAATAAGGAGSAAPRALYTVLDLRAKTVKELQEVLGEWSVKMPRARKDEMIARILQLQRDGPGAS